MIGRDKKDKKNKIKEKAEEGMSPLFKG